LIHQSGSSAALRDVQKFPECGQFLIADLQPLLDPSEVDVQLAGTLCGANRFG
jgi:hypothetical protein